jgi:hypothetical protein
MIPNPSPDLLFIESGAHRLGVLPVPPPHLMFLASQVQEATGKDSLTDLAYAGGLAALCVREIDGETVELPARLPRDLVSLAALGRGFVMVAYEVLGGYSEITAALEAVMGSYRGDTGDKNLNPT